MAARRPAHRRSADLRPRTRRRSSERRRRRRPSPGRRTPTLAWAGDARAYGWDPQLQLLTRYTTDHTVAAYLAAYGIEEDIADEFSSQIRVHLTDVTPATAHQALIPCGHRGRFLGIMGL
ncbi:hypothetical protein [Streptomyces goshikiensis]|uniref:hypothetical protein n=1 Tax=Streptomyces goshikiensis TaxID=1942 RepID=UPI0036CF448E